MNEDFIIIYHDDKAMTWDAIDLSLMQQGASYTKCTIDYCDYERYNDVDIAELTTKVSNDWENVKRKIELILEKNLFEIAFHMKGYTMIIEKMYLKG